MLWGACRISATTAANPTRFDPSRAQAVGPNGDRVCEPIVPTKRRPVHTEKHTNIIERLRQKPCK